MLNSIPLQEATLDFIQQNGDSYSAEATTNVTTTTLISPAQSSLQYPNTSDFSHHRQHQHQRQQEQQHQQQEQQHQSMVYMNSYHYRVNSNKSMSSSYDDEYNNRFIEDTTPSLPSSNDSFRPALSLYAPGDLTTTKAYTSRGVAGFVFKLYQCLQEPHTGHTYARWYRHAGKDMFVIDCIPKFTKEVLPRLFKHGKFSSFVRQLNIYGFQRDTDARKSKGTKDKETCRWHHPYFQPGRHDLFPLIRRKATLNCRSKQPQPIEDSMETIIIADPIDNSNKRYSTSHSSASSIVSLSSSLPNPSVQHEARPIQSPSLSLLNINHSFDGCYKGTSTLDLVLDETIARQPSSSFCMQDFMHANTGYAMEQCTEQPMEQPLQQAMEEMNRLGYNDTSTTITTTTPSPRNRLAMEQNLQQQLSQLQTNFTSDYHFYSKQIRLAHNLIKQQESQLNRLEAISAYRQSHMNHRPGLHHDNQQCKEQPIPPSDSDIKGKKQAVPENRALPLDFINTANQK
ncbi:hypothetical protein [Absidia glauca]|uniref:HSF-type DNA-binding domain-containing protein n=1 Tax=Absidia glauca TaxID=4829 RepID=A0A168QN40_ABSGL|nr:hypothetical protein [Absidia glauca]